LPSFTRAELPEIAGPGPAGVRIVGPETANVHAPFVVRGRFAISEDEYARRGGTPHRDLVLTVLREPLFSSCHPFKDCLFFKGDVETHDGLRVGWFGFDVWSYAEFRIPGRYFVRISLGETLSPFVETRVG
jgi:hypothetical protein